MLRPKSSADSGNAVLEFVAVAVLIFAPVSSFAAVSASNLTAKAAATAAATQLARAAVLGDAKFEALRLALTHEFGQFELQRSDTSHGVEVTVSIAGQAASARQVS